MAAQNFAWITTWDDHGAYRRIGSWKWLLTTSIEVSDNGYRDGASGLNNTEQSFLKDGRVSVDQRKMNAVRAYFEWMPIR